jgi:hypothetical protein
MRERAGAATPGPWWFDEDENCWRLHGVAFKIPAQNSPDGSVMIPEQVVNKQILKAPKHGTPYAEYWPEPADAAHVTGMHPSVALAVADLLEAEAWHADGGKDGTDHVANLAYHVARVYLGEAS